MKIAIVRKKYNPFGGAERYLNLLSNHLIKEGHEVHIFANKWPESQSAGLVFHHVPMIGGLSVLKIWSFAIASWWMLKRFRADVVISNERIFQQDIFRASDGVHRTWLKIRMRHLSLLKRISILINPLHWTVRFFDWYIFTCHAYKKIIAPSEFIKRDIIQNYGVDEKDIHVVYNGVDLERFKPENKRHFRNAVRKELGYKQDDFVLIYVGTGFERKGLRFVIESMSHLPSNTKLIVIGKGRTGFYRNLAERSGVLSRIKFLGPVDGVDKYYAASDVLVLPTLYEPMANVILEALASGIPVITSRDCGNAEIITEGKDGWIINNPTESREIAGKVAEAVKYSGDPSIENSAREKASEFTLERMARNMMNVIFQ